LAFGILDVIFSSNKRHMKYTVSSSIPPSILNINNKTYVVPSWIEVPLGTQLDQIIWKPEKIIKVENPNVIEIKSSSGGGTYQIRKIGNVYQCNCPGYWRSKDRVCKHIKQIL
jgi:hypothetical protein